MTRMIENQLALQLDRAHCSMYFWHLPTHPCQFVQSSTKFRPPELPAKINTQSDLGLSDRINSMISSAVLLPEW